MNKYLTMSLEDLMSQRDNLREWLEDMIKDWFPKKDLKDEYDLLEALEAVLALKKQVSELQHKIDHMPLQVY